MAAAAGRALDLETTCAIGRELEGIFHGTPSGVDPAAAALGACFRFVRGEPPTITPLAVAPGLRIVVAHGERSRSTGAAVGGVRERWRADPARYERIFDEVAALVDRAVPALAAGDVEGLGRAFDQNQALLAALGVSSPETDALVARARAAGAAGAKLTGGGAGGAVIAVGRDPESVARGLASTGITTFVLDVTGDPAGTPRTAVAQ
jgi:mevalonate kinase